MNNAFDIIKKQISILPEKLAELNVEPFTLYPFDSSMSILIPPEFKKYNINPREVYDVLDDFDKTPDKLTDNQKVLRKKYLNIVLELMDIMSGEAKKKITQMIDSGNDSERTKEDLRKYVLGNYDPSFNTIKRIINLLITELDSNNPTACTPTACTPTACTPTACTPTDCTPPVNKTPFIIAISILSIFLVIMIIISIYLGFKNK